MTSFGILLEITPAFRFSPWISFGIPQKKLPNFHQDFLHSYLRNFSGVSMKMFHSSSNKLFGVPKEIFWKSFKIFFPSSSGNCFRFPPEIHLEIYQEFFRISAIVPPGISRVSSVIPQKSFRDPLRILLELLREFP